MRTPHRCPLCGGSGKVMPTLPVTDNYGVHCNGCGGTGIVWDRLDGGPAFYWPHAPIAPLPPAWRPMADAPRDGRWIAVLFGRAGVHGDRVRRWNGRVNEWMDPDGNNAETAMLAGWLPIAGQGDDEASPPS